VTTQHLLVATDEDDTIVLSHAKDHQSAATSDCRGWHCECYNMPGTVRE